MKSIYLICAKCGSDHMRFRIEHLNLVDDESCGVDIICEECGELTSVEAHNEQQKTKV